MDLGVTYRATVTEGTDDFGHPEILVEAHVEGVQVDRPRIMGWSLPPRKRDLAQRLVRAIHAGAVFDDPQVKTDVYDKTYIDARCKVLGRKLNTDLRRLGY